MPGTMWTSLAASRTSNLNSLMSSAAVTCPPAYLNILSDLRPVELNRFPLIIKRPQLDISGSPQLAEAPAFAIPVFICPLNTFSFIAASVLLVAADGGVYSWRVSVFCWVGSASWVALAASSWKRTIFLVRFVASRLSLFLSHLFFFVGCCGILRPGMAGVWMGVVMIDCFRPGKVAVLQELVF